MYHFVTMHNVRSAPQGNNWLRRWLVLNWSFIA